MKIFLCIMIILASGALAILMIMLTDRTIFRRVFHTVKCKGCGSRKMYISNWVSRGNFRDVTCMACGESYSVWNSWRS